MRKIGSEMPGNLSKFIPLRDGGKGIKAQGLVYNDSAIYFFIFR